MKLEDALRGTPAPDSKALMERSIGAARALGLVDVSYAIEPSPVGALLVGATSRGLIRIAYNANETAEIALEELARRVSPRVLEAPAALDDVRRQLDEYFEGDRRRFDTRIDWSLSRGVTQRILQATARVPFGSVTTYRAVAGKAGNDRAYRAAGNALGSNPIPIV